MNEVWIKNARLSQSPDKLQNLFIRNGRFVDSVTSPTLIYDLQGKLVLPGLIETHLHLDKACILDRCILNEGTLAEAIEQTAIAKSEFTEEDVYQRASRVLEMAIKQGTTHIRTHVEIDSVIGLTSFYAIQKLKRNYSWAIGLEICVFPQEGMLNNPGTEALLLRALDEGADLLGGCPYTDSDPNGQIKRLFEIATERDIDLDFHLDFDLDISRSSLQEVCQQTRFFKRQKRVTIGHVTKLSMLSPSELQTAANLLASSGVHVTSLPSTDLFLMGRESTHAKPRGVAPLMPLHDCGVNCSISSNNIGNPYTPFGDASLIRQANLYANVSQLGTPVELIQCLDWISSASAHLLGLEHYGLSVGCWADFIVLDAPTADAVIAEINQPLMGFKKGHKTFERKAAILTPPNMLANTATGKNMLPL